MARREKRIAGKPARWMAEVHSPAICKAGRQNGESFQSRPARAECGLNVAARGAAGKPGILRILAGWCPQFESFSLLVSSSVVYSAQRDNPHREQHERVQRGMGRDHGHRDAPGHSSDHLHAAGLASDHRWHYRRCHQRPSHAQMSAFTYRSVLRARCRTPLAVACARHGRGLGRIGANGNSRRPVPEIRPGQDWPRQLGNLNWRNIHLAAQLAAAAFMAAGPGVIPAAPVPEARHAGAAWNNGMNNSCLCGRSSRGRHPSRKQKDVPASLRSMDPGMAITGT